MADKIKSFFQKRIKDEKFKHAGKGHKLNESTSSSTATTSKSANVPKRQELTSEAKTAGQAALARLENKKPEKKFNISYSAIQACAQQELEQERLALAHQGLNENVESSQTFDSTEQESSKNGILAVSGVYYRCPLVSDEVLEKKIWYEKIQEFLSTQLSEDEAGLSACLIIHSCNNGEGRIKGCVETLCKYLENILNNPDETKYWKIRMSNKIFQEKVKPLRGSMDLLKAAGFIQENLLHQDKEEDFLVWSPNRSSTDILTILIDALNSAESVELVLDRNVQVLLPTQAAEMSELPSEFFLLSAEDCKREQEEKLKIVERNEMLMTQAMREKLMKEKEKKYLFTLIRVRFPDNIILQGTFSVTENFEEVIKFVKEHLNNALPFYLITATREKLTEADYQTTLQVLNLVPAVVLTFFWIPNSSNEVPSNYLKETTLSLLQSL